MKPLAILLLTCLSPFYEEPNCDGMGDLSIAVKGSENQEGMVYLSVYSANDDFSDDHAGDLHQFPMKGGAAAFKFGLLKANDYAFKLFVDLNGNGSMDTNVIGIPKEPYAFSNNAMGLFGPPDFEKASFRIEQCEMSVQQVSLRGE